MTTEKDQTGTIPLLAQTPGAGRILRRCFGYLRNYRRYVAGAYILLALINILIILIPQFIRRIVDEGIRAQNVGFLTTATLTLLGLALLKSILTYYQGRWIEIGSQGAAYDLRKALHSKLSALSFSYHDRTETGQLLSRAIQDVERLRFLTGRAALRLLEGSALLISTAIVLLQMNPGLALLALGTMPLVAYRAWDFGRRFRPLSRDIQDQLAVLTTRLEQNLRGARIVKAFAQERAEIARFEANNLAWFKLSTQAAAMRARTMPLIELLANVGTVLILWYGGTLVIRGQLTLGEMVAFTTYLGQLVQPVRRLGMILPAVVQAIASGERVFEILDAQSEVHDAPDAIALPPVRGKIRFDNVSFAYFGRHKVLKGVSFEAQPGQVIALLGATGSGKSTIINLLPRFYDPTAGRITVDGYDIRDVTLKSLRDQIGIVLQETTLFAASIRENLAFGKPEATDTEIFAAAEAAQAHEFIQELPEGYATRVGERGVTLSGGQKQRIAIARALLKDPRILILDDALASVDTETEHLIQLALEHLMQGRTSIVIAQRLSTVRAANLVLVLEKGRIAASGTHAELLRNSGLYAEIYQRQLREEERTGAE
ncbi:MAG: ABC transporter ATP-binding protein [Anaerolineae bacterium]|nr:ABC transporter ATP-binding protein [Anaerolineae bacterium]